MKTILLYIKIVVRAIVKRLVLNTEPDRLSAIAFFLIKHKVSALSPADSLRLIFTVENKLYQLASEESVRYDHGLHTKHRHTRYHDFFIHHIEPGSRVLDVGCGIGIVAFDIAQHVPDVSVDGIDFDATNILHARQKFSAPNLRFLCGNALTDLPVTPFDIIVLSNVLEHIEQRVEFLCMLQKTYHPRKFLIRVPIFERDWQVPLQQELGVDYRLDQTHYIEYRQEEFALEMARAGLDIIASQVIWGEIWAEAASHAS